MIHPKEYEHGCSNLVVTAVEVTDDNLCEVVGWLRSRRNNNERVCIPQPHGTEIMIYHGQRVLCAAPGSIVVQWPNDDKRFDVLTHEIFDCWFGLFDDPVYTAENAAV